MTYPCCGREVPEGLPPETNVATCPMCYAALLVRELPETPAQVKRAWWLRMP